MKMMSSTSITSTIGVTLMLELTLLAFVANCNSHWIGLRAFEFFAGCDSGV